MASGGHCATGTCPECIQGTKDPGKEITRAIGGEVRVRGDLVENQDLGDLSSSPGSRATQMLARTRLHFSLAAGSRVKGFFQGQFYLRDSQSGYSRGNLYQAYLELSGIGHAPVHLTAGRQELCYGSAFFFGSNDFFEGLVWDGVKLRIAGGNTFRADLLGARYVKLDKDSSDDDPSLFGIYSTFTLREETDVDVYFFHHKGGFKFFHEDHPDGAQWFTLGARAAGKINEQVDYEIEPLCQFGKIGNQYRGGDDTINAYGGHIEGGYSFPSKYNPRLFAAYAFGTGDNDTQDEVYGEFHGNIYHDTYLVGDTGLIPDLSGVTMGNARASGMHVSAAGVSLDACPQLNVSADYHYFLADKVIAGAGRNVGSELNLTLAYRLYEDAHVTAGANRFFAGDFVRDSGGPSNDVNYFFLQTQLEF
ncbi:MAG: alginate export family protein [Endomicrobiales bacterium]